MSRPHDARVPVSTVAPHSADLNRSPTKVATTASEKKNIAPRRNKCRKNHKMLRALLGSVIRSKPSKRCSLHIHRRPTSHDRQWNSSLGILCQTCNPERLSNQYGHAHLPVMWGDISRPVASVANASWKSWISSGWTPWWQSLSNQKNIAATLAQVPPPSCAQRTDTPGSDAAGMGTWRK